MRKVLALLILLIPIAGFCGDKHKPKIMPVSRWKETERMKTDSTIVPFYDTLYFTFRAKAGFSYHIRNGFIYNGTYTVSEDSIIDFGTSAYKIAVRKPTSLMLVNDLGIHRFIIDSSDTLKTIKLDTAEKLLPVTSIDQMIGHWTVYKRNTKEQAMGAIDNAVAIRSVYITGPSTDGKQGYVFSGVDANNDPSWYIKGLGTDQVLDCAGKTTLIMKVIKCQRGEMILEDGEITYYFKQFK